MTPTSRREPGARIHLTRTAVAASPLIDAIARLPHRFSAWLHVREPSRTLATIRRVLAADAFEALAWRRHGPVQAALEALGDVDTPELEAAVVALQATPAGPRALVLGLLADGRDADGLGAPHRWRRGRLVCFTPHGELLRAGREAVLGEGATRPELRRLRGDLETRAITAHGAVDALLAPSQALGDPWGIADHLLFHGLERLAAAGRTATLRVDMEPFRAELRVEGGALDSHWSIPGRASTAYGIPFEDAILEGHVDRSLKRAWRRRAAEMSAVLRGYIASETAVIDALIGTGGLDYILSNTHDDGFDIAVTLPRYEPGVDPIRRLPAIGVVARAGIAPAAWERLARATERIVVHYNIKAKVLDAQPVRHVTRRVGDVVITGSVRTPHGLDGTADWIHNLGVWVACVQPHLVIATTPQLAERLVRRVRTPASAGERGDHLILRPALAGKLLASSFDLFVDRTILRTGTSRAEATRRCRRLIRETESLSPLSLHAASRGDDLVVDVQALRSEEGGRPR